jgi:hypothetical protein
LPYRLLVDLDSFLFELRFTYEIVGKFLGGFFGRVLGRKLQEAEVIAALEASGNDTKWIGMLRRERVVFFHQTAPWIVFEVERGEPFKYNLVVLKKNARDLSNAEDYVRLHEYRAILQGFEGSMEFLAGWLVDEIEKVEGPAPA